MKTTLIFFFALLLLWAPPVPAQAHGRKAASVSAYKLIDLKVTGTERYTNKEILAASGLQLGQNVGEGDLKEAAAHFGETGLFSNVVYSFSYSAAGTRVEFQLTDTDKGKLLPVHFENFVWFTDAELLAELQKRIPLFKQFLPVGGTLADRVADALQSILSEKQLPGRIDYIREGRSDGGDLTGMAYRVADVDMPIQKVEFPGASAEFLPLLSAVAGKLTDAEYARSSLALVARMDLLPVYLQRGYLKATFETADARVVKQSAREVQVDAIVPVKPGKVYSLSDIAWKGNAAIPTAQLQGLLHMPAGKPANAVRLSADLASAAKLYRSRGYMEARVIPVPQMEEDKDTVHYDLNVSEGELYKMGELELQGLDSQSKVRMENAWTLREGEAYNADYPKKFLEDNFRLIPGSMHWGASVHESLNAKDKTVDVTIKFTPQ